MRIYRPPEQLFRNLPDYPFQSHYLMLNKYDLQMHYVDEGEGNPIVLLHGNATWSYLYRKMIPVLAQNHRVIAPDLIGFGKSDRFVDLEEYSYDFFVDTLTRFIKELELQRMTLVVQCWGGPIGLRFAMENPDLVERLVILNTWLYNGVDLQMNADVQREWVNFVANTPDLPIGDIIKSYISNPDSVPADVIAAYNAPFPSVESKAAPRALSFLVPTTPEHPSAKKMIETRQKIERWEKPTIVIFSNKDPFFPEELGQALAAQIPGTIYFKTVRNAVYFFPEEQGKALAQDILNFLDHEQRGWVRHPIDVHGWLEQGDKTMPLRTKNMSLGGAMITTNAALVKGNHMYFHFGKSSHTDSIKLLGEVIDTRADTLDTHTSRLAFRNLDAQLRNQLFELIH